MLTTAQSKEERRRTKCQALHKSLLIGHVDQRADYHDVLFGGGQLVRLGQSRRSGRHVIWPRRELACTVEGHVF